MTTIIDTTGVPRASIAHILQSQKPPILSKDDISRLRALSAKQLELNERRLAFTKNRLQERAKEAAIKFAFEGGPAPSARPSENDAHIVRMAVKAAEQEWFNENAKPFLLSIFAKVIAALESHIAERDKAHREDAQQLGLTYQPPITVRAVGARLANLLQHRDALATSPAYPYAITHLLKLTGIESPQILPAETT